MLNGDKKRIILLIAIMAMIVVTVTLTSLATLYDTAFEQQRQLLVETVKSQAHLMDAMARFDAKHSEDDVPGGAPAATLQQIFDAHSKIRNLNGAFEYVLAKLQGDQIAFIQTRRGRGLSPSLTIPTKSNLAEPMRKALLGESGAIIALDYEGIQVLAAYEPVKELDIGLVAKIDLEEVRMPYIKTGAISISIALALIILGVALFQRISAPIIKNLADNEKKYRALAEQLQVAKEKLQGRVETQSQTLQTTRHNLTKEINGRKEAEALFHQAQKMEAIGVLVGGIAHDFNNMLAGIMGNIYLAKKESTNNSHLQVRLESIDTLCSRAAEMVRQLLTFARKDRVEMKTFPLNSYINDVFELVRSGIPENIDLSYKQRTKDIMIHGNATQLQQVLINLINNARDALANTINPIISCTLEPYNISDKFRKLHPELIGEECARLTISDNGSGIPEEQVDKIFEPFFTTKEVGEGTGLGLAMVYGAIQTHGGVIEVESALGEGTAFHIYLPMANRPVNVEAKATEEIMLGHGENILLADDDKNVRDVTSELLEHLGYNVLLAADGEETLKLFKEKREEIDLVILDVVMPKMGGVEVAKCIHEIDEDMPFIFATGYDKEQTIKLEDEQMACCSILEKPYTVEKLGQSVRESLHYRLSPPNLD